MSEIYELRAVSAARITDEGTTVFSGSYDECQDYMQYLGIVESEDMLREDYWYEIVREDDF